MPYVIPPLALCIVKLSKMYFKYLKAYFFCVIQSFLFYDFLFMSHGNDTKMYIETYFSFLAIYLLICTKQVLGTARKIVFIRAFLFLEI